MTAYFLMTRTRRALSPSEVRFLAARHGHLYPTAQVERALAKMAGFGWVELRDGRYLPRDPKWRPPLPRTVIDDSPDPGWKHWQVGDDERGPIRIEEAVS